MEQFLKDFFNDNSVCVGLCDLKRKIDDVNFDTNLTDFQILYPHAELSQKGISKDSGEAERHYTISDFTDLGYLKSEYIFY